MHMPMIRTGENAYRILLALSEGDKRFNELLREVKKASLAKELTMLDNMRYINRKVIDSKPPTTLYNITKLGREFLLTTAKEHLPKLQIELKRLRGIMPEKMKDIKSNI